MRLSHGARAPKIGLPAIDGSQFDSSSLQGKPYLLSFFRFATCPFCNMRVNQLVNRYEEFGDDFAMVAIFESPLDHLRKHTVGHQAVFPILSDHRKKYYKAYGIEQSLSGLLKGMFMRMPTMIKGMAKGYIPLPIKGSMIRMPADFLVDREGLIQAAYYGADEGDHLPFDKIETFSRT